MATEKNDIDKTVTKSNSAYHTQMAMVVREMTDVGLKFATSHKVQEVQQSQALSPANFK